MYIGNVNIQLVLLSLIHYGAQTTKIVTVRPNEPVTVKLPVNPDQSNHTSAIVVKTKLLLHPNHDENREEITLDSQGRDASKLPHRNRSTHLLTIAGSTAPSSKNTGNVFMTAVYNGHVNHWSLESQNTWYEKTLCTSSQNDVDAITSSTEISVGIFSTMTDEVSMEIDVTERRFSIELYEEVTVDIAGNYARLFEFIPHEKHNYGTEADETYLVSVMSDLPENYANCLFVAINPPGCPWKDSEDNVRNSRMWARMLRIGYYPVNAQAFPSGFTISILPAKNSSACLSTAKGHFISETNTLRVKIEKTLNSYKSPVVISIGSLTVVAIIVGVFIILSWHFNFKVFNQQSEDSEEANGCVINSGGIGAGDESLADPKVCSKCQAIQKLRVNQETAYRDSLVNEIIEDYKNRPCSKKSEHCFHAVERLKKPKQKLTDMTRMAGNPWHRRARSKSYIYLIPLILTFYFIPAAQMVYTEYIRSRESGNMEQCYLNYGCSRPYGILTDFNHVISNIGYLIYGFVFMALVYIKSCMLPQEHQTHRDHVSERGTLQQHSLFYSMGVSMIYQGFLSCIFHICPSNISLQFDTTVMYLMMILVFIKIYQLRHPDIAYNAYHTIYAFSVVLVFEALSLYIFDYALRLALYVSFMVLYFALMLHVAIDIYYYGTLKTNPSKLVPIFVKHAFRYRGEILQKSKFFYGTCFIVINLSIMFFIMFTRMGPGKSLSTPLLLIGGANITLYIVYYYVKKFLEVRPKICPVGDEDSEQEEVQCRRVVLFLLSFITQFFTVMIGLVAGYFYYNKHQSRNRTPPESRDMNSECNVMDFFDNHDMWHFTSSTALFLACIGLLIVDDDILFERREDINVF